MVEPDTMPTRLGLRILVFSSFLRIRAGAR